jgi:adenylate kinase
MKKHSNDGKLKLVLMGPPGSGKGTQAGMLCEKYLIPHISSGDVLRAEVAANTGLGMRIKSFMDKGEIGPVELITEAIISYIDKNCPNGFLLDGFPRTVYQAEKLAEKHSPDAAVLLSVPEEEIINRITGRRTCEKCKAIFHIQKSPPRMENICDNCGGRLIQRSDDTAATAANRIRVYNEETRPVISFYESRGMLATVSGMGNSREIFMSILDVIK